MKHCKKIFILSLLLVFLLTLSACSSIPQNEFLTFENFKTSTEDIFDYDNALFYFAMTDRFLDGNPENNNAYGRQNFDSHGQNIATFHGGDFLGLTQKLKEGYFKDLGVNVIWVSAPYEQVHGFIGGGREGDFAHYGFHGYYALDWTMMDQNFGTVEEFRTFVDTAHEQGIRIFLDIVMNHVGYPNMQDMMDFGYGGLTHHPEQTHPSSDENFHTWTEYVNWESEEAWKGWWGDWVRSELPGYHPPGDSVTTQNLMGLPDIRTEVSEDIGLAPILITKWGQEDDAYSPWILPAAKPLRKDLGLSPVEYITQWLAAWPREFGIDGFRIDTAKHIEVEHWARLKEACNEALQDYRLNNPDKAASKFEDDFYFVGEVWGQGLQKNYYYDYGFDSLINFTFQGERRDGPAFHPERKPRIYQNYADTINTDPTFNVLSYISQHDTILYPLDRRFEGISYLLLLPGQVKLFYGDETGRDVGPGGTDRTMGTRSPMNWDDIDEDLLEHTQKIGSFRSRNIAVGAGEHHTLKEDPFIFTRTYEQNNLSNQVLVYIGPSERVKLDVSSVFEEGAIIRDAYTMLYYQVEEGHIKLEVSPEGIALLEVHSN